MLFNYYYHPGESPTFKLTRKEDTYIATLELPGVTKEEIDISYSSEDGGINIVVKEERYLIPIQSAIDQEGITAKLDLGILTVTIPKKDTSHKIQIK